MSRGLVDRGVVDSEAADAAAEAMQEHVAASIRAEIARETMRRLSQLEHDDAADAGLRLRRVPQRLRYPRWGWREAVRVAVRRRMYTPQYLVLYQRYLRHRGRALARGHRVEFQGLVMTGRGVEFHARPGHGRIVVGPWCWIGDHNKLRSHEGQLTLGPKVVMGRENVVNAHLDVEIGEWALFADWIYVCDFDHRFARLDIPIKDQGIVKGPVRIGPDVWIGEKATVLRGVDVGQGAVVASHAVVNRDLPPFAIAAGAPARVVGSRLPDGMDPAEAATRLRRNQPIPGDPLEDSTTDG